RAAAQERAHPRDAFVCARRLTDDPAVLDHPRAGEFVDDDLLAIEAVAALPEDHRAGRAELHGERDRGEKRRYQDEDKKREHDVTRALEKPARADKWRVAHAEH